MKTSGRGRRQRRLGFLPDPFRHECSSFAGRHHLAHQLHRLRRDAKAERREARGEPRNPQDADRVFTEGVRHVAQPPRRKIRLAAVGVDDPAVAVLGHGVDGQVAPPQIVLER